MENVEDMRLRVPINQTLLPGLQWHVLGWRQQGEPYSDDLKEDNKLHDPNENLHRKDLAVRVVAMVPIEIVEGPGDIENTDDRWEPHLSVH